MKQCPNCLYTGDFTEYKIVEGIRVFDPRSGKNVVSDNPALIMLDLVSRGIIKVGTPITTKTISFLADYCDKQIAETNIPPSEPILYRCGSDGCHMTYTASEYAQLEDIA